jgi:hypothetical protein
MGFYATQEKPHHAEDALDAVWLVDDAEVM